ncbi:MAG: hypothetical protein KatS3mg105_3389 [Gemmatales bacterium]|nr:MAG: hypothetical protein KatS3mg105_3389 [Gemmatales bacterium]
MAFNPLRTFRRHQKVLLAAATIMCMFIFILASGQGDFFYTVTELIGVRGGANAAELFGKTLDERDIEIIRRQRELADRYMLEVIKRARNVAEATIHKIRSEIRQNYPPLDRQLQKNESELQRQMFILFQMMQTSDPSDRMRFVAMQQDIQRRYRENLNNLVGLLRDEEKTEQVKLLTDMIDVQERYARLPDSQPPYFDGVDGTLQDLLDYLIWLRQADDLGIEISAENLTDLVILETQQLLNRKQLAEEAGKFIRGNISEKALTDAVRKEFRVRLAKMTLLGFDAVPRSDVGPNVTPYELWKFYKKQRTENKVAVLPIAVDQKDFLAKVESPNEEELRKLYDQYKDVVFSEDSPTPGFKQTERVKVEWVSGRVDSPYYLAEAKKRVEDIKRVLAQSFPLATAGLRTNSGPLAEAAVIASHLAPPPQYELLLLAKYKQLRDREEDLHQQHPFLPFVSRYRFSSFLDLKDHWLTDQAVQRPETVAAFVGNTIGSAGTGGSPVTGPTALQATAVALEARQGGQIWATLFLAGSSLNPVGVLATAAPLAPQRQFRPLESVRQHVEEELLKEFAYNILRENLEKLSSGIQYYGRADADELRRKLAAAEPKLVATTLAEAAGAPLASGLLYSTVLTREERIDLLQLGAGMFLTGSTQAMPASIAVLYHRERLPQRMVRAFVDRHVEKWHLVHGQSSQPRDRFTIAEDPGLKPLYETYAKHNRGREEDFPTLFFSGNRPSLLFYPSELRGTISMRHDQLYWHWNADEYEAYVPDFAEVRAKVEKAWRLQKARKFAEQEAEEIAALARRAKADAVRVLKDGTPHSGTVFFLEHVAPLQKPPAFVVPNTGPHLRPYQVPPEKIEYPTRDFAEKLFALEKPGDTVVLHNRPMTIYYVASLIERQPPPLKEFYTSYDQLAGELLGFYAVEVQDRRKTVEATLAALRQKAGLHIYKDYEQKYNRGERSNVR